MVHMVQVERWLIPEILVQFQIWIIYGMDMTFANFVKFISYMYCIIFHTHNNVIFTLFRSCAVTSRTVAASCTVEVGACELTYIH